MFDAAIHFTFEGSFLYHSTFGRQVNTSTNLFAKLCQAIFTFRSRATIPYMKFYRARICSRRFSLGLLRPNHRLTRNPYRSRRRTAVLTHSQPDAQKWPSETLLDNCIEYCWTIRRVSSLILQYFHMINRLSISSWMTFCPEWLTGSPNLDTSNVLFLWVYLVVRISSSQGFNQI